jgi:predicted  nucleic acid-binding Zn-ribbon protein
MRETLSLLRGLQELDQDLYRVKDELKRLPEERARRRERIDQERERLGEIDRKIHETQTRIKEIEDMTTGQRQRLRKLENEIGSTADTALIVAYQHEMRTLRRDINEAEEEGLALMEVVEKLSGEGDEQRSGIEGLEKEFEEYSTNIDSEIEDARSRKKTLDDERQKRMSSSVQSHVLDKYEKLLDAREGQAMALLEGRVCQGCYVSVPNNIYVRLARAVDLVECPSCGRILYLPDAE